MHAEHCWERESAKGKDINWEYLYWLKYAKEFEAIVVSTQEQRDGLKKNLSECHFFVPKIEVIPAGGIGCLRYPEVPRKEGSLIAVSRLAQGKRLDWVIKSVVKAHEVNPNIFLDIYGNGGYEPTLRQIVRDNRADEYIQFKGYTDVTNVYKNYEVFITLSIRETLGLSTMEAVGSGTAVIGLDVPYGNRLFIKPRENGYLVDYDMDNVDEEKLTDDVAKKIIEIFKDEQKLKKYHQKSYEIANGFMTQTIAEKWEKLLT